MNDHQDVSSGSTQASRPTFGRTMQQRDDSTPRREFRRPSLKRVCCAAASVPHSVKWRPSAIFIALVALFLGSAGCGAPAASTNPPESEPPVLPSRSDTEPESPRPAADRELEPPPITDDTATGGQAAGGPGGGGGPLGGSAGDADRPGDTAEAPRADHAGREEAAVTAGLYPSAAAAAAAAEAALRRAAGMSGEAAVDELTKGYSAARQFPEDDRCADLAGRLGRELHDAVSTGGESPDESRPLIVVP